MGDQISKDKGFPRNILVGEVLEGINDMKMKNIIADNDSSKPIPKPDDFDAQPGIIYTGVGEAL